MLKLILKNKIIFYLFSRYGTYALQFVVSMIIAAKLGPYYLGIYGFMTLMINYFAQINFGVPHSLNVLMVHNKMDTKKCNDYIGNSFAIYGVFSIIIICLFFYLFLSKATISSKYPISIVHCSLICIIAIAQYYSSLCSTILRVRNKVNQLAISQSSHVLLNLSVILFFNGDSLIYALMICQFISLIIFLLFALKEKLIPNLKDVNYCKNIRKEILKKGFYLFLYNSCFYFILISIRTLISGNYSVIEFGLFNFSYTLAHAVLLLIEALTVIIFPKIIDMLSTKDYAKIEKTISTIRVSFVSTSHLLIYIAFIFFPFITMLMPQYKEAQTSMNLIALAILMNTNSYGYSSFLIAQNKERISARISFIALIVNIISAEILINVLNVSFSYVILAVMFTYFCFSLMSVIEGKRIMGAFTWKYVLKEFFPLRLLIPYLTALGISIMQYDQVIFMPFFVYVLLNIRDIKRMYAMAIRLVKNPNVVDV